ncbi:Rv3654c family TadE-like protein [Sinomonas halotolerans]|uniref:Rv3654c family TadE-like protein n=1 Tax=Sinomonas halotolerans TaxID=1644133 RepID=A0ABU9X1H6_9MICC
MPSPRTVAPRTERERGAGTILALGLGLLLVLGCGAVALFGQALAASARAAGAADLAALAAADAERGLTSGPACGAAQRVAQANGAELVVCEVEAPRSAVRVIVQIETGAPWDPVRGRARAGPPP